MADNDKLDNIEEKKSEDFSKKEKETHGIYNDIIEILDKTTSKEAEDLGFTRNEKVAGVYGDGTTYGAGVEEGQYNVVLTGKPRKFDDSKQSNHNPTSGTIEKQVFIGAKRVESQIDFEIRGKNLHLQYRSPEAGFFRGTSQNDGKTFMVKERLTTSLDKAKKELETLFADAAQREVGFLSNTKLGVEDRLDASTTSIVENLEMEKLTIKSLVEDEIGSEETIKESEEFNELPSDVEPNIDKVVQLNTPELENGDDQTLLFDDNEGADDLFESLVSMGMNEDIENALEKEFGTRSLDALTPAERNDSERLKNVVNELNINEVTTSGPVIAGSEGGYKDGAFAGSGGYNTKNFAKPQKREFAKESKGKKGDKKSEAGAPFNISAEDPFYESAEAINEGKKDKFNKTSYAKSKNNKRPKIDKNYNIIPEDRDTSSSKPYVQVVKVDPDYHPLGMPFVKPNSKEEWERTSGVGRDHDKLERMGIKEGEDKSRLMKRKFSSEFENKKQGINKRYIVTEKTSEEYEKDRWEKLALFNKFETIKEAEELNEVFDNIDYEEGFFEKKSEKKEALTESKKPSNNSSEKVIEVEKPDSTFGITQKFYEKDFLNENKKFILDLNTKVFVPNPNAK